MENRSMVFLDLYRQLEETLEQRFRESGRKYGSVVMDFMNDDEGASFREDLNVCREVRNLLSHHAAIHGQSVVEPSEALIGVLREVIEYVRRPQPAMDFATPRDKLMIAYLDQSALRVMREMQKRGFSHVPVFQHGEFMGVFSVSTVFSYVIDEVGHGMDKRTTIGDRFERKRGQHTKRLVAIFVTENGQFGERLLGMITPWDVIGQEQPGQAAPFVNETE